MLCHCTACTAESGQVVLAGPKGKQAGQLYKKWAKLNKQHVAATGDWAAAAAAAALLAAASLAAAASLVAAALLAAAAATTTVTATRDCNDV
jgi:Na+(H+)/acetate symporter ActP